MRRISIAGLVAAAAVLGCFAVPAGAMAQPTAGRPAANALEARVAGLAPVADLARLADNAPAVPAATSSIQAGAPMISCVTAADCLGIGGGSSFGSAPPPVPARVARWNGSSWKGVGVTLPKGDRYADLNGVSCRWVKTCLVVGSDSVTASGNGLSQALALADNGTSLRPMAVPLPRSTRGSMLEDVSCATTRNCVAVGFAAGATSAFGKEGVVSILETWNGSRWSLHTAYTPGRTVLLSNVSCILAGYCMILGYGYNASFTPSMYLVSWNGKKLTTLKPPAMDATNLMASMGLSCTSPSSCALVGAVDDPAGGGVGTTAFVEIWNGKTWHPASVRWPKGTTSSDLMDVWCYASGRCEAVGEASSAPDASVTTANQATAVSLDGTSGELVPVPVPAKSNESAFSGVSCVGARSCVAIGAADRGSGSGVLVSGAWNGRVWKLGPGF